jgi:hypothetical protein
MSVTHPTCTTFLKFTGAAMASIVSSVSELWLLHTATVIPLWYFALRYIRIKTNYVFDLARTFELWVLMYAFMSTRVYSARKQGTELAVGCADALMHERMMRVR